MFRIKYLIFSLFCVGLILTSCEDTPGTGTGTGGGNENAPFVSLQDDVDVLSADATVTPGTTFRVKFDATSNTAQLKAVEVVRDGFSLTPDEFDNIDLDDAEEQNPQLLFGTDKDGITWTYEFVAPDTEGSYLYDFIATDDNDLESIASITITVEGPLEVINPTISVESASTLNAPAGTLIRVNTSATKGTYDLASISVWEDGSIITDLTRIRFNDVDFDDNPLPLFSPDTEGFDGNVTIRTIAGTHDYVIRVTDTEGNNADFSVQIVEEMTTTPLQNVFGFVLFSNASGMGLGGLDLDNGVAVPSASDQAEIRDLGIDIDLPASSNWIQKVEAVNSSELRIVDVAAIENFSYEAVTSKEQVAEAYNSGATVDPSPVLEVGDILAVASPTNIYVMKVETVNVTTGDNNDYYEFSIKY